jgi:indolepyruvate ferredoxin oxidoreductase
LEDFIARRVEDLKQYWDARYAARYAVLMERVQAAARHVEGGHAFAWAAARGAYKLMAYKDEYEVARLYSDGRFRAALRGEFENFRRLRIHLAPPVFAKPDPQTGQPEKKVFGPWMFPLLRALAAFRRLREGPLDVFGRTAERRLERDLRDAYLAAVEALAGTLSAASLERATSLADAAQGVRGFGPVKTSAAQSLLAQLQAV